jgi:hypothetical protein
VHLCKTISLEYLLLNKVGEYYLPSIVRTQYFSIMFNEKKCELYLITYGRSNFYFCSTSAKKQLHMVAAIVVFISGDQTFDHCDKFAARLVNLFFAQMVKFIGYPQEYLDSGVGSISNFFSVNLLTLFRKLEHFMAMQKYD